MEAFIQRHEGDVLGVLSGFDRLLFKGTLRSLSYAKGVDKFLGAARVQYKDYKSFVMGLTAQIRSRAEEVARETGRPLKNLKSSHDSKEDEALAIAKRDGVKEGLVCVLSCVEPCITFSIRRNGSGGFGFVSEERRCLFYYFYYLDREFGLMHIRLATWLPFGIQVCLNGREYLARQLTRAGIGFEKRGNCFLRIDDLPAAQRILQGLEVRRWERLLKALAKRVNPLLSRRSGLNLWPYYWSVRESEYATDVMFKDAEALRRLYPALADHAIKYFHSENVLRFLGRRVNTRFEGEVSSSYLRREEGLRVKHWVEENSIKMYDKEGSVLRIETTINNVRRFKVRRMTEWGGDRRMRWIPMRQAVADLDRRVEVSRAANKRYLEALAVVDVPCPAREVLDKVSRPVTKDNRPYRPLRPVSREEAEVFEAVLDGGFLLKGFSNRQLRELLGTATIADDRDRRRESGRTTRLLRLLRAHGLIRKVSGTRYYRVTPHGHLTMTAALKLRNANLDKLVG
jgi:hypothetical protein